MNTVWGSENQDKIYSDLASGHSFRQGLILQMYNSAQEATFQYPSWFYVQQKKKHQWDLPSLFLNLDARCIFPSIVFLINRKPFTSAQYVSQQRCSPLLLPGSSQHLAFHANLFPHASAAWYPPTSLLLHHPPVSLWKGAHIWLAFIVW